MTLRHILDKAGVLGLDRDVAPRWQDGGSAADAPQGHNTLIPEAPVAVRAHHGSVSLEVQQQIEKALKDGDLRAVVATASLELGAWRDPQGSF